MQKKIMFYKEEPVCTIQKRRSKMKKKIGTIGLICSLFVFLLATLSTAYAEADVTTCVGATVIGEYQAGVQLGSVVSSDPSIVTAQGTNTGTSITSEGVSYLFEVRFTGVSKGTATVDIYDGTHGGILTSIDVKVVDHQEKTIPGVPATCTKTGLTEGKECAVCGTVLVAQEEIPFAAHTEVTDAGKEATCAETGLTEGKHCAVCGTVLVAQQVIPFTEDHTPVIDAGQEPTCTLQGITEGSHCSVCGLVLAAQEFIPLLPHTFVNGICSYCGTADTEAENYIGAEGWVSVDGQWYYGDENGFALVGPHIVDGTLYCFNEKGQLTTGWTKVDGKWYFAQASGAVYHSGWMEVNGTWYYFRNNGEMAVGWVYDQGTYYYMGADGTMKTGWVEDHGSWYYMSGNGSMYTGWLQSGDSWYLMKPGGAMAVGWTKDGDTWYYFTASGSMKTGWLQDKDGLWYWFDSNGSMAKGWKEINGRWEMFDNSGIWLYTWEGQS